ncbi:hypothetical protein RSOLAG1IB_08011 [Rhizoctonia solani AG-1 IB]|uniref:Uncharacterized protein n=1 Tax=Thanatephorus cucumeris (strain AG1-IB / isolate 7/3/14) TaxID=1108050 RepID=A0A0B7FGD5_THACB|nr:hypothetical protein RSOLAG1IB_08011 [Rhizoctonia solani AG-1 IB]
MRSQSMTGPSHHQPVVGSSSHQQRPAPIHTQLLPMACPAPTAITTNVDDRVLHRGLSIQARFWALSQNHRTKTPINANLSNNNTTKPRPHR